MFLDKSFIYITAFKNQHIQLINRFEINNEDDVLYYLLSVIKEADLIKERHRHRYEVDISIQGSHPKRNSKYSPEH